MINQIITYHFRIIFLFSFIGLGTLKFSFGQVSGPSSGLTHYANKQVFKLKAGTAMSINIWRDVIYRFHDFQQGRITLREGFSPTHPLLLDFNIYMVRIEYITDKGDTTALENSKEIKSVTIGEHIFYNDYPSGYVEKINQTPVALGSKHLIKVMMESGTGERFSATDWQAPASRYDRLYIKDDEYYFIDKNETLLRTTLPAILKLYQPNKKEVKRFIKKHKIDFRAKEDLLTLLEYCEQLE